MLEKRLSSFENKKKWLVPKQREGWKLIGRTEESIFQNAFADKQRAVFFDIHQKESRGEPLTQTELHIKAVGFSQAPEFIRDIGFAALGAGIVGAKGFAGKVGLKGAKIPKAGVDKAGKGVRIDSKQIWKDKDNPRLRMDVENQNPGGRPGQIHLQDGRGQKFYYDHVRKVFYDKDTRELAARSTQDLLKKPEVIRAIKKGEKILGLLE